MANIQQTKSNTLGIIDAALAILDRFPTLDVADSYLSFNTSLNPFPFLMDLFKSTTGYNVLLEILSKFIALELPLLEMALKGVLLTNIKNIISCSVNPFISDDILRRGIIFSLPQIDLNDTLYFTPFDKKVGQYFYFDANYDLIADLKHSTDFNCLLWYMKNNAVFREVWGKQEDVTDNSKKLNKKNGIITLEYHENSASLKDAEGRSMSIQTPGHDYLHVFIGNTKETDESIKVIEDNLNNIDAQINSKETELEEVEGRLLSNEQNISRLYDERQNNKLTETDYQNKLDDLYSEREEDENRRLEITTEKDNYYIQKQNLIQELNNKHDNLTEINYRPIDKNYYYRHTLIEFNTDYIMSLRLFDSKVIAAQLIDCLTSLLTIDIELSYKQQLIKHEIKKMIQMIVETDDTVVSDCFFTFSNEDYETMLEKAELNRMGLFSVNGEESNGVKINAESILNSLNQINSGSSQEDIKTIIEGSLTSISKTLSDVNYEEKETLNFNAQMNFIENLMNNLAYVIASSVLSPRLYLLIMINMQLLGQDTNFNLEKFISQFKQLIVAMLRAIRDSLIKYLVDELMKLLTNIAAEISVKLSTEQAQYYARLIKRLIDCMKRRKGYTLDFNIDNVDYADIVSEELEEPKNSNC